MTPNTEVEATHQALGEFVIVFQWIENLYRQIGWFILDPGRRQWPPMQLRTETNENLIDKVTDLFTELTRTYAFKNGEEKAKDMEELHGHFHALRRYRNRLLHSTYIELKGGGEVHGYLRSNRAIGVDLDTGELIYDQEEFSAETIYATIGEYGDFVMRLSAIYVQLIHWSPFSENPRET